jgi:hypothetical protein
MGCSDPGIGSEIREGAPACHRWMIGRDTASFLRCRIPHGSGAPYPELPKSGSRQRPTSYLNPNRRSFPVCCKCSLLPGIGVTSGARERARQALVKLDGCISKPGNAVVARPETPAGRWHTDRAPRQSVQNPPRNTAVRRLSDAVPWVNAEVIGGGLSSTGSSRRRYKLESDTASIDT